MDINFEAPARGNSRGLMNMVANETNLSRNRTIGVTNDGRKGGGTRTRRKQCV